MTDGTFSTPPPLRPNEFEGGVLSNKVFHGLIYFYVFDFLVLIKFLIEYFSGHNISSYISEPLFIIYCHIDYCGVINYRLLRIS